MIDAHNLDFFRLTKTWIRSTTTSTELLNCTPQLHLTQCPAQTLW